MGVEQQLERDCAVMVLEDAAVVVAQGLGVLHRNQERIVDTPKQELANLNLKANSFLEVLEKATYIIIT